MICMGCMWLKTPLRGVCAGDRAIPAVTHSAVGASGAASGQAAAAVANDPGALTSSAWKSLGMIAMQHAKGFRQIAAWGRGWLH